MKLIPPNAYILTFGLQTGGVETWIRDFLYFTKGHYKLLPRLASESSVFTVLDDAESKNTTSPQRATAPCALFHLVRELRALRKSSPTLHAHNLKLALLALIYATSCPLVYFSHNNFGRQLSYQNIFKRRLYFLLERVVLKKSHMVFTFSREDHTRMSRHRQQVELLTGSYNDLLFPSNQKASNPARSGLLWIGRLSPVKNPLLALQAFELLAQNHPSTLTIVGDGPLRRKLEKAVKKCPVGERVTLTGSLSPDKIRQLLQTSEVLLVTSLSEGPTPRNIYEALACSTPVVTTRPGDPNMVIESASAGSTAEKLSPEYFVDAIKKCLVIPTANYDDVISDNRASEFFPTAEKKL